MGFYADSSSAALTSHFTKSPLRQQPNYENNGDAIHRITENSKPPLAYLGFGKGGTVSAQSASL